MPSPPFRQLEMPGAEVWYAPGLLSAASYPDLFRGLQEEASWKQDHIRIQGQQIPLPRLTAWHGDPGTAYGYSGVQNQAAPWTPHMEVLRQFLRRRVGADFNSVLLNLYRDGKDSVSWHADDEPELGPLPIIASVSLGAPRKFSFKHRTDKALKLDLLLSDGDVLVMQGDTQRNWLHQVPKTTRPVEPRMNLTFRIVRTASSGHASGLG